MLAAAGSWVAATAQTVRTEEANHPRIAVAIRDLEDAIRYYGSRPARFRWSQGRSDQGLAGRGGAAEIGLSLPGHKGPVGRGRPRALLRGHAAVQREDRAGGEAAFVAGQKQDAGRDLLGRAETAEELPRRQRLARGGDIGALPQDVVEIRRVDRARRDCVAADAV